MPPVSRLRGWLGPRRWPVASTVLLVGLLIRELFSFWTGHPYDLEVWIRTGFAAAHGHNPYLGPLPPVPGVSFGYTGQLLYSAAYLPLWPEVFGASYLLWERIGAGNPLALYFLLKQGPILGDVAVAALLYRFVLRETGDRKPALAVLTFWSMFPYDIAIGAIWGQLDSVTTALLLVGLLAAEAEAFRRNLAWGLGIFAKWITVVFLPLEFFRNRGVRRLWPLVSLAFVGASTAVAALAVGWKIPTLFAVTTSSTGGGGGGMNYVQLVSLWFVAEPFSAHPILYEILSHLWIPGCVLAGWYATRWLQAPDAGQTLRALLFVLTVLLILRWGLYEQYMLYPFALLAADVYTRHPLRRQFFYFLIVVASGFLLTNNVLGIWFAAPVSPASFTFVQNVDSSAFWGTVRYDLLDVFAVLMTVSLGQLLLILLKDDPSPRPWLIPPWPLRARREDGAAPASRAGTPGP